MEDGKRMCRFCKRSFPNGKSLGGHMKLHLSLTLRGSPGASTSSPKPQIKKKAPVSSSTREEFKCLLCGKSYKSWRSYRGHMRWHQLRYEAQISLINQIAGASEDPETNHAAHLLVGLSTLNCSCNYGNFEERFVLKRTHECFLCQKKFPTGQALGVHMKAHMPEVLEDDSERSHMPEVSEDDSEKTVSDQVKPDLGFDLNVEPPEEEVSSEPSDDKVVVGEDDAKKMLLIRL